MIVKSWNCTGLSTKLNTPTFTQWLKDADVVALQETFLDTTALQVAGFTPFIKCATPPPPGKRHRATGGLVALISSQLASVYRVLNIDSFFFEGFESQCIRFERLDDARIELPASFVLLNCYVVAQPAAFDFHGLYFALEAFLLAMDTPAIIAGDFNAHWKLPTPSRLPLPRDRDFRDFVLNLEDSGFEFHPSTPSELRKPTYVSPQGCSIIDYVFTSGIPASGFRCEQMTVFGHRTLSVQIEWPTAQATVLRDRRSHRKHFQCSPPVFSRRLCAGIRFPLPRT
jgi:hypothetical protein